MSPTKTRQKLIDAAKVLNEEKTFHDILIEVITEKAGVAKGTFYTYFKRKEDIFSEIAFASFDAIKEKLADESIRAQKIVQHI